MIFREKVAIFRVPFFESPITHNFFRFIFEHMLTLESYLEKLSKELYFNCYLGYIIVSDVSDFYLFCRQSQKWSVLFICRGGSIYFD